MVIRAGNSVIRHDCANLTMVVSAVPMFFIGIIGIVGVVPTSLLHSNLPDSISGLTVVFPRFMVLGNFNLPFLGVGVAWVHGQHDSPGLISGHPKPDMGQWSHFASDIPVGAAAM